MTRIGYEKHLSYLTTELLFRRSDILVSSTLSFSLTPLEEKRRHLVQMTEAQLKEWVDLKSEFRAMNVCTFDLPRKGYSPDYYTSDGRNAFKQMFVQSF